MKNLLILIIVLIIIYLFASEKYKVFMPTVSEADKVTSESTSLEDKGEIAEVNEQQNTDETSKEMLENNLIAEGIIATNCEEDKCSGDLSFAKHEYGLPGIEFSEWAMYQTLDPRTIASNKQFVEDRLGNPQTWTGATYSPDRHDTYDSVPWRGLYRPTRVAVSSPDQIPDIDTSRNPATKKFTWSSSEVE